MSEGTEEGGKVLRVLSVGDLLYAGANSGSTPAGRICGRFVSGLGAVTGLVGWRNAVGEETAAQAIEGNRQRELLERAMDEAVSTFVEAQGLGRTTILTGTTSPLRVYSDEGIQDVWCSER